jgi:hypothetical protein
LSVCYRIDPSEDETVYRKNIEEREEPAVCDDFDVVSPNPFNLLHHPPGTLGPTQDCKEECGEMAVRVNMVKPTQSDFDRTGIRAG